MLLLSRLSVRAVLAGALALSVVGPLRAQRPMSHVVRGVVFDSIANAPLIGAEMQLAPRDSAGTPYRARTDLEGRYTFTGVPPGRYVIGFYHEALELLGLDAPVQAVDLDADSVVQMPMSIPSGGIVRMLRCGDTDDASGNALLAGFVRTAAGRHPVIGATVTVTWSAVSTDAGMLRTVPGRTSEQIWDDGMFSLCGIPSGVVLTLDVQAAGFRALSGPVTIPESGVLRQDVLMVDTATTTGPAEIRGRLLTERGQPVVSGRVRIPALGREVSITDGAFTLMDLPVGTWAMELRAIGIEPRSMLVQASARRNATLLVRVSEQAQRLDAVTILGRADLVIHVLDAVLARHRVASGTVFLPGSPQLMGAQRVTDLLSAARGFTVVGPTDVRARSTTTGERCRKIGVYVNGVRAIEGIEALDATARPDQVLAVEAYPDLMSAPFEWRTGDGTCAVVAMWTRR
ncbi:MAG: carboxypeptidase regulatory-like domain-containing protein [Gemmatimonadetes bacterium]|nr:carboxypeptidase regulatory-like domain-containing protein [Gemmatimonadota bacterium]